MFPPPYSREEPTLASWLTFVGNQLAAHDSDTLPWAFLLVLLVLAGFCYCVLVHCLMLLAAEAIVVTGASFKGFVELRELSERGFTVYFSSKGAGFLDNVLSLSFSVCIYVALGRTALG